MGDRARLSNATTAFAFKWNVKRVSRLEASTNARAEKVASCFHSGGGCVIPAGVSLQLDNRPSTPFFITIIHAPPDLASLSGSGNGIGGGSRLIEYSGSPGGNIADPSSAFFHLHNAFFPI